MSLKGLLSIQFSPLPLKTLATSLTAVVLLSACGGGGGDETSQPPTPPPAQTLLVSVKTTAGGQATPAEARVPSGQSTSFRLQPNPGFRLQTATGCGGTLSGEVFTTAAVTEACQVNVTFSPLTYTISTRVNGAGSIAPTNRTVTHGESATFTVSAPEQSRLAAIRGCNGSLTDSTYTTGAITADCEIMADFSLKTYQVDVQTSAGGNASATNLTIVHGQSGQVTFTANEGYLLQNVTGCGGTLSGNTYTTGPLTTHCAITASFTAKIYQVDVQTNAGGSASLNRIDVAHGKTATISLQPAPGFKLVDVKGCGGQRTELSFTTAPVTANCTILASFAADTLLVKTSISGEGTISPTEQLVTRGQQATFMVKAAYGFAIDNVSGCDGTLSVNESGSEHTYKTAPVQASCEVKAQFIQKYPKVTVTLSEGGKASVSSLFVEPNKPAQIELKPADDFTLNATDVSGCPGTLTGQDGNFLFTINQLSENCELKVNFSLREVIISAEIRNEPGAGSNNRPKPTITPAFIKAKLRSTVSFKITPAPGYGVGIFAPGATCNGELDGDTYTFTNVRGECTFGVYSIEGFQVTHQVIGNGTISPKGRVFEPNSRPRFLLSPAAGYDIAEVSGCRGQLEANYFTLEPLTAACTLTARFVPQDEVKVHTVKAIWDSKAAEVKPATQQVKHGRAATLFYYQTAPGYKFASMEGCGASKRPQSSDDPEFYGTFYIPAVNESCDVNAAFTRISYRAKSAVKQNGAITPATQSGFYGDSVTFTITPDSGYVIDSVEGCGGSLAGNSYTTGPFSKDCLVSASFRPDTPGAGFVRYTGLKNGVLVSWANPAERTSLQLSRDADPAGSGGEQKVYDNISAPFAARQLGIGVWYAQLLQQQQGETIKVGPRTKLYIANTALNDTGYYNCHPGNPLTTNYAACPQVNMPKQDGDFGRDQADFNGKLTKIGSGPAGFDFTKIGADGKPLAIQNKDYDKNGSETAGTLWSCVQDNVTGLLWQVLEDIPGAHYSWYNPDPATNGGFAGSQSPTAACSRTDLPYCNTHEYIKLKNRQQLCGHSDWRLPSNQEVAELIQPERLSHQVLGPLSEIWTSNTVASDKTYAWLWTEYTERPMLSRAPVRLGNYQYPKDTSDTITGKGKSIRLVRATKD